MDWIMRWGADGYVHENRRHDAPEIIQRLTNLISRAHDEIRHFDIVIGQREHEQWVLLVRLAPSDYDDAIGTDCLYDQEASVVTIHTHDLDPACFLNVMNMLRQAMVEQIALVQENLFAGGADTREEQFARKVATLAFLREIFGLNSSFRLTFRVNENGVHALPTQAITPYAMEEDLVIERLREHGLHEDAWPMVNALVETTLRAVEARRAPAPEEVVV